MVISEKVDQRRDEVTKVEVKLLPQRTLLRAESPDALPGKKTHWLKV